MWRPPVDPMAGQRFEHSDPGSGGFTRSPSGADMLSPGVAEQYWNLYQGQFDPMQYWNQVQGRLPGGVATDGAANSAYGAFQNQSQPGLDPYYARAKERSQQSIDQAMAARGAYGSSAATQAIGNAFADLDAEQANREAQYALQQQQLGIAQSGMGLSWLEGGMNAALMAQNARRARIQDRYANQMGMLGLMMPTYMGAYGNMLDTDMSLLDAGLSGNMAAAAEARNQSYRRQANLYGMADWTMGMGSSIWGPPGAGQSPPVSGSGVNPDPNGVSYGM